MASQDKRAHFGRTRGHKLTPGQAARFETVLPRLALDLSAPPPASLAALFPVPVGPVEMEIGFGGGEHLVHRASRNPDVGFIGCEAFRDGMAKTLAAIERLGLRNIRLHFGDAVDVLAWLPDASVARVFLLYPDPWPKRRHWKRRFVNTERLAALARIIAPGGDLRFASDISSNITWTLVHVARNPDLNWPAASARDWREAWDDWPSTRYEQKALREGRVPAYFRFERTDQRSRRA